MRNILIGLAVSYFLGAIPTAYLFGRMLKGIDIRQHGSGNVGATNAFRILGKGPGTIVLLVDIMKGVLAITLVGDAFGCDNISVRALLGCMVVIGHNWTVFLRFKGGKGIATSLGVLIGLAVHYPTLCPVLLFTLLAWLVPFLFSGFVSLASLVAALVLPLIMTLTKQPLEFFVLGVLYCLFVWIRHIPNIKRLMTGQERRVRLPYFKKPS